MNKVLFGAGGSTSIHPVILGLLCVATVMILSVRRQNVVAPFLALSMLTPIGQVLVVGPLHFQVFRILIFIGWVRILIQKSTEGRQAKIKLNAIDKAMLGFAISSVVCYTLLWQASAALLSQLGVAYSSLGLYFFFRFFIRDQADVDRAIKVVALVATVIALLMLNEQVTGKNVLAIFGGVPYNVATRGHYYRSQGPFEAYLTAGAFGASLIPLFLTMWRKGGKRGLATIGMGAALVITLSSNTSTASSAVAASLVGLLMWNIRDHMKIFRRVAVAAIVALHLAMKAPVWALLARVDLVGGSDGYHRFLIVDNFIRHFFDWFLMGARNYSTWVAGDDDMWDLANQYVFTGETTGLLSLIFFMATIVYSFKYLGRARIEAGADKHRAWFMWLLGVAMVANCVAFMGISYFDQTRVFWALFLALIAAAAAPGAVQATVKDSSPGNREEIEPTDEPDSIERWAAQAVPARLSLAGGDRRYGGSSPI